MNFESKKEANLSATDVRHGTVLKITVGFMGHGLGGGSTSFEHGAGCYVTHRQLRALNTERSRSRLLSPQFYYRHTHPCQLPTL